MHAGDSASGLCGNGNSAMNAPLASDSGDSLRRSLAVLVGCACAISLITFGLRSIFGLFTDPVVQGQGWSREVFALAIAVQNLFWGIGQPFAGALVDRFGPVRPLAAGGVLYALGIAVMAVAPSPLGLQLSAGVLVGLGMSGASYITVLSALGRLVPEESRSWALGLCTAAGSLGQFVFAPVGQAFIAAYGWQHAALLLAGFVALVPLLAFGMRGRAAVEAVPSTEPALQLGEALRHAAGHRSYWLLLLGFFVCGFQLAFITVHLPPYLNDLGVRASLAGWAIGVIGFANVIGAYAVGVLEKRHSKRRILSAIYFGRALVVVFFITAPVSVWSLLLFAAVMGLLWLSTVPPTSGLVAVMFGTRHLATLFGLVFFCHQLGSFLGVWLGAVLLALTGDYSAAWWLSIALGVAAGILHWPIVEQRAQRFLPTAAG